MDPQHWYVYLQYICKYYFMTHDKFDVISCVSTSLFLWQESCTLFSRRDVGWIHLVLISISDPHYFDADPDPSKNHLADPDRGGTLRYFEKNIFLTNWKLHRIICNVKKKPHDFAWIRNTGADIDFNSILRAIVNILTNSLLCAYQG